MTKQFYIHKSEWHRGLWHIHDTIDSCTYMSFWFKYIYLNDTDDSETYQSKMCSLSLSPPLSPFLSFPLSLSCSPSHPSSPLPLSPSPPLPLPLSPSLLSVPLSLLLQVLEVTGKVITSRDKWWSQGGRILRQFGRFMELPNGWLWPGGKDGIGPKGVRVLVWEKNVKRQGLYSLWRVKLQGFILWCEGHASFSF